MCLFATTNNIMPVLRHIATLEIPAGRSRLRRHVISANARGFLLCLGVCYDTTNRDFPASAVENGFDPIIYFLN